MPPIPPRFLLLLLPCLLLSHLLPLILGQTTSESTTTTNNNNNHDNGNDNNKPPTGKRRIAIIGGGVGGTFAAKYLAQHDMHSCLLDSIVIFDPYETRNDHHHQDKTKDNKDEFWQGCRVQSHPVQTNDGDVVHVELGASIIYSGNKLVKEMVEEDGRLQTVNPFAPPTKHNHNNNKHNNKEEQSPTVMPEGTAIWNGKSFPYTSSKHFQTLQILWRYNSDILRMSKAVDRAIHSFQQIYNLLDNPSTYFQSPDQIWNATGLLQPSRISFSELLDQLGIQTTQNDISWWKAALGLGSLRDELITGANLSNYNQNNTEMNGLAGLVSFVPTKGELFKIHGGNDLLPKSALRQAQTIHHTHCPPKEDATTPNGAKTTNRIPSIRHEAQRVTTLISNHDTILLYNSHHALLGSFDVVLLAAPLQQCGIAFYVKSFMDDAVLAPMPFRTTHEFSPTEHMQVQQKEGLDGTLPKLPSSAKQKYTQTITYVVSHAALSLEKFAWQQDKERVKSVLFTSQGKEREGISSISHIAMMQRHKSNSTTTTTSSSSSSTSEEEEDALGIYKFFASKKLSNTTLQSIFGPHVQIEYIKVWGGTQGGAYPAFHSGGAHSSSLPFLLYGTGVNVDNTNAAGGGFGSAKGPALFYINAMEAAVSALEISAIGAKAVAKLVKRRLGLGVNEHEEEVGGGGGGVLLTEEL